LRRGKVLKNNADNATFVHNGQVGIVGLIINVVVRRIRASSGLDIDVPCPSSIRVAGLKSIDIVRQTMYWIVRSSYFQEVNRNIVVLL
jgi:hypothetical protein